MKILTAILIGVSLLIGKTSFACNRAVAADSLSPEKFIELLQTLKSTLDSLETAGTDPTMLEARGFYIGTEQDFLNLVVENEDRNYTMGLAVGFLGPKTNKDYLVLPMFRRWVTGLPLLFLPKSRRANSLFNEKKRSTWFGTFDVKAAGFTPRAIELVAPVLDDRPYANPVTIGFSLSRLVLPDPDSVRRRSWSVRSSLALGLLGSGVGRSFQTKSHREHWFGSTRPVPAGWDNQIANGGGFTMLYTLGLSTPLPRLSTQKGRKFQVQTVASGELMAGMFANAALGMGIKMGWFQTPFWIGNDISSRDISQEPPAAQRPCGLFWYFRPRVRLVAHNALLNGQILEFLGKSSAHTLSWGQTNHALFEFETGVAAKLRAWTITLEPLSGRSPEFDTGQKRWHFWGTLHLALTLNKSDPRKSALAGLRNRLDYLIITSGGEEEEEE